MTAALVAPAGSTGPHAHNQGTVGPASSVSSSNAAPRQQSAAPRQQSDPVISAPPQSAPIGVGEPHPAGQSGGVSRNRGAENHADSQSSHSSRKKPSRKCGPFGKCCTYFGNRGWCCCKSCRDEQFEYEDPSPRQSVDYVPLLRARPYVANSALWATQQPVSYVPYSSYSCYGYNYNYCYNPLCSPYNCPAPPPVAYDPYHQVFPSAVYESPAYYWPSW
eukprot:Selendium_serpulae@DN5388_c0_g1_i2.p1